MAELTAKLVAAQSQAGTASVATPANSNPATPEALSHLGSSQKPQQQTHGELAGAQTAAAEARRALQEQRELLSTAQNAAADARQQVAAMQQRISELEVKVAAAAEAQREAAQREGALQRQLAAARAEAAAASSRESQEALLQQQIQQQQDRIKELAQQLGQAQQAAESARQEASRVQQAAATARQELQGQADALRAQLAQAQAQLQEQEATAAATQQDKQHEVDALLGRLADAEARAGSAQEAAAEADRLRRRLERVQERLRVRRGSCTVLHHACSALPALPHLCSPLRLPALLLSRLPACDRTPGVCGPLAQDAEVDKQRLQEDLAGCARRLLDLEHARCTGEGRRL